MRGLVFLFFLESILSLEPADYLMVTFGYGGRNLSRGCASILDSVCAYCADLSTCGWVNCRYRSRQLCLLRLMGRWDSMGQDIGFNEAAVMRWVFWLEECISSSTLYSTWEGGRSSPRFSGGVYVPCSHKGIECTLSFLKKQPIALLKLMKWNDEIRKILSVIHIHIPYLVASSVLRIR